MQFDLGQLTFHIHLYIKGNIRQQYIATHKKSSTTPSSVTMNMFAITVL
jgi:hypothetical protein